MVHVDGKFFSSGGARFRFNGVTYGTFAPRADDGELYPERQQVKQDFASMGAAGFTVVRTYTAPPDDVVAVAADADLKVLAGVFYPDWRYLVGCSRFDSRVAGDPASSPSPEPGRVDRHKQEPLAAAEQSPMICPAHTTKRFGLLPDRWTGARENANLSPLPIPLPPVLAGVVLGGMATDRGDRRDVSMNGAGDIAGLPTELQPAAGVVELMATEAAARLTAR